jgi:hypothetical protein
MSNIYIGSARHTIALTSLEIGCIMESIADMIDWEPEQFQMRIERMQALHKKMKKYYSLVLAAEVRDQEEE